MRQQGNGEINEFNEHVGIAAIRESLSLANGAARCPRPRRAGRLPPTSRRRDVANYRAVLKFVGGFNDRLRQRQRQSLPHLRDPELRDC